jgi:hypothetical protein
MLFEKQNDTIFAYHSKIETDSYNKTIETKKLIFYPCQLLNFQLENSIK